MFIKKALIREPGHPIGVPAPLYLECTCREKLSLRSPAPGACLVIGLDGEEAICTLDPHFLCSNCGAAYDRRGWLVIKGRD